MLIEGWVRADDPGEQFGFGFAMGSCCFEAWSCFIDGETEHLSALGHSCEVWLG